MCAELAKICQNFSMKSIDNVGKICLLRGHWQNPWNMHAYTNVDKM